MRKNVLNITLMLLFPVICFSQVNQVEIELYDITDSIDLEYEKSSTIIKIGNRYKRTLPFLGSFDVDKLKNLDDTLYVNHFNYSFDTLPIKYHDFVLTDKKLSVKVYAKPSYNYYYEKDLEVSYSRVTKNDSVVVKAFYPNHQNIFSIFLELNNGKEYIFRKGKENLYYSTLHYDDLSNGFFQIDEKQFLFQAKKWFQTHYLISTLSQRPTQRENRLIQSYFDYAKKSEDKYKKLEQEARWERDSLISVIHRLQGKAPFPVPEIEPIETEFFDFVNQDAFPKIGFATFFENLQHYLIFENRRNGISRYINYAGNITFELTILKDGKVRVHPLHQMKDDKLYKILLKYLRENQWIPAKRSGRVCNQTVVLSLNLIGSKQAINAMKKTKKFEPTKEMVKIEPLKDNKIILEVGQKIYYQADVHGSVGAWVYTTSENEEVLENVDAHFAYHTVQIEGETGGDRATKTYVFEAKKKGKTKLTITNSFRGETTGKKTIKIVVK